MRAKDIDLSQYTKIVIPPEKVAKLKSFVDDIVAAKASEEHHQRDSGQESKRFMTGFGGEMALEEFFGKEFIDYTIGESTQFHVSDLKKLGYNVGVKSVEKGKEHIIFKVSKEPELLLIKESDDTYYLCGLATHDVLMQNQDDSLILSSALRKRGTKTAFTGYDKLTKVNSLQDLDAYKSSGQG